MDHLSEFDNPQFLNNLEDGLLAFDPESHSDFSVYDHDSYSHSHSLLLTPPTSPEQTPVQDVHDVFEERAVADIDSDRCVNTSVSENDDKTVISGAATVTNTSSDEDDVKQDRNQVKIKKAKNRPCSYCLICSVKIGRNHFVCKACLCDPRIFTVVDKAKSRCTYGADISLARTNDKEAIYYSDSSLIPGPFVFSRVTKFFPDLDRNISDQKTILKKGCSAVWRGNIRKQKLDHAISSYPSSIVLHLRYVDSSEAGSGSFQSHSIHHSPSNSHELHNITSTPSLCPCSSTHNNDNNSNNNNNNNNNSNNNNNNNDNNSNNNNNHNNHNNKRSSGALSQARVNSECEHHRMKKSKATGGSPQNQFFPPPPFCFAILIPNPFSFNPYLLHRRGDDGGISPHIPLPPLPLPSLPPPPLPLPLLFPLPSFPVDVVNDNRVFVPFVPTATHAVGATSTSQ